MEDYEVKIRKLWGLIRGDYIKPPTSKKEKWYLGDTYHESIGKGHLGSRQAG